MPRFKAAAHTSTPGQRRLVLAIVLLFTLASAYLSLVVVTKAEALLFPGNPIRLPVLGQASRVLPGIDLSGDTSSQARINVLIVGIDRRPSDGPTLTRTDTIEIATIDPRTKSASIMGIPRDLIVKIPMLHGGTYEDRVNTPLVVAQTEHYPQGPIGLMEEVIQNNFGIKIDHYVVIDFSGFQKIIDGLGGIDVNVPTEVYDPYYSASELPGDYNPQHFYPGVQHMNGATALAYSRIRFSSDDLDRIQRQQRVIFATIAKAKSLNVLKNAPTLWANYQSAVQTDISDPQIPGLALLASQVQSRLQAVSLGPYTQPYTTAQGADVLLGNWDAIHKEVQAVFTDQQAPAQTPTPATNVRVEVENGAGINGLAAHVADYLESKGYARAELSAGNPFDKQPHATSEILTVGSASQQTAYLLANWLGIAPANVRKATASETTQLGAGSAPIVVILGTDQDFSKLAPTGTPSSGG
ncbi:MAG TPA: LCP family protein [Dehalococcoidia bacterium]|nr:LCP family protein [Dehalococcoidia bacterium]